MLIGVCAGDLEAGRDGGLVGFYAARISIEQALVVFNWQPAFKVVAFYRLAD